MFKVKIELKRYCLKKLVLFFLLLSLVNYEVKNIIFFGLSSLFLLLIFFLEKRKKIFSISLVLSSFLLLILIGVKILNPINYFSNPYKIENIDFIGKYVILKSKKNKKILSSEDFLTQKPSYGDLIIEGKVIKNANFLEKYKSHIVNYLFSNFEFYEANFFRKILLGEDSKNLKNIKKDFFKTGNLHLLAISGFHIGIIFGILLFIFRKLKFANFIIFSLLGVYIFLTDFSPSAVRAFLFLLFLKTLKNFTPMENLFLAGIVYLTFFHLSISFLLSFLATFAILYSLPSFTKLTFNLNLINLSVVSTIFQKFQIFNFFISFILTPLFSLLFVLLLFFVFFKIYPLKPFLDLIYNTFLTINTTFAKINSITFINVNSFFIFFVSAIYTMYLFEKSLRKEAKNANAR